MPADASLRLAVISDIHLSSTGTEDSSASVPSGRPGYDPMADLLDLARTTPIEADILVCAGDIANKGDAAALAAGWAYIHDLAAALGVERVIATPGNHDLETRRRVDDVSLAAKSLRPSFPTGDQARDRAFWEDGLTVVRGQYWRALVLNSCVDHPPLPLSGASDEEVRDHKLIVERGTFNADQEEALLRALSEPPERFNFLICHHHPVEHEHEHLFQDEYGPMRGGTRLLARLREDAGCQWVVIHGHRHIPRLLRHAGGDSAPIILGAASLGARLWHPVTTVARNEFHVIEVAGLADQVPGRLHGLVRSYMWGFGPGWEEATPVGAGLPGMAGFGGELRGERLAAEISTQLDPEVQPTVPATQLPADIFHLLPDDARRLEAQLAARGVYFLRRGAEIVQVAFRL